MGHIVSRKTVSGTVHPISSVLPFLYIYVTIVNNVNLCKPKLQRRWRERALVRLMIRE